MTQKFSGRGLMCGFVVALLFVAVPSADHSWNNYHWYKSLADQPVTIKTGDNVSSQWDAYLDEAIADWNKTSNATKNITYALVVKLEEVAGQANPKNCRATYGRIEVCNSTYGNNGWLGIASIWLSGGHIVQATTKVNDTYFNTATYNTPAWRRMVMCQELAHDFGLDHQDEVFNNRNLGSCMDYTNDPDGGAGGADQNDPSNEHPDDHDFQQLLSIYNHADGGTATSSTAQGAASEPGDHPGQWGRLVRSSANKRLQVYELDLGNGQKKITHVFWADPEGDARGKR